MTASSEKSKWEMFLEKFTAISEKYRAAGFRPLLKLLTRFRITATIITNIRIILGVVFFFWLPRAPRSAAIFLIFILILDTLDGALARYQERASDRGKFLDLAADHFVYATVVMTLPLWGLSAVTVGYNIFIMATAYILGAVKKEEGRPSDWIIKPRPRLSYLKAITIIPFFVFIFFEIDVLKEALLLSNGVATLLGLYYLIVLERRWHIPWKPYQE